jgi:soluble lytic murein transglycosylase
MKTDKQKQTLPLSTIALIIAGILGATLLTPKLLTFVNEVIVSRFQQKPEYRLDAPSAVLALADIPPAERQTQLEEIANQKESTLDRARARYLMASDLLREDYDGGKAIVYLKGLEKQYPVLAPYILLRQGRAYELTNDTDTAKKIWLKLVKEYPDSLITAEAYYKLGTYDQQYWQYAITSFPQYPRTHEIAYKLLEENPDKLDLLLLLAKYDQSSKSNEVRDLLVKKYRNQLQPSDWETIANGYWQKGEYLKAAQAYADAPVNPQNLYRIARGYQISNRKAEAKSSYQDLISKFPNAPETGTGLRQLASLSTGDEAISYLNRVGQKYPESAPKALKEKASLLTKMGRYKEATTARDQLIASYPNSDEAAEYRWQVAKGFANGNNLIAAWQWAQEITVQNPDSDTAPKAAFWVGKWADKLNQKTESQKAYQYVINNYPHSYYAWRAAVKLGKEVGDFTTIKELDLAVKVPEIRPIPPAGSNLFKELFLLGEDRDAINLFNAEVSNPENITVTEQFTQGLLKQVQGKYLESINLIWSLKTRDNPDDFRAWQILRKSPEYWYALFPFPYEELIVQWSSKRNLNPFLVTALIRQESRFQPKIKSPAGATGLMQVMPDTGKWIAPQIEKKSYDLMDPNDNINMGTWYLDHTHQTYQNNSLLAVASYNAGPGNVSNWVKQYGLSDFDEFVEKIPFAETKSYIETVFGNYWNYVELYDPEINKKLE